MGCNIIIWNFHYVIAIASFMYFLIDQCQLTFDVDIEVSECDWLVEMGLAGESKESCLRGAYFHLVVQMTNSNSNPNPNPKP